MTVLLYHNLSGTDFKKLIFSNNLVECEKEVHKWLDKSSHEPSTALWDKTWYYALIYDMENDTVLCYNRINNDYR